MTFRMLLKTNRKNSHFPFEGLTKVTPKGVKRAREGDSHTELSFFEHTAAISEKLAAFLLKQISKDGKKEKEGVGSQRHSSHKAAAAQTMGWDKLIYEA